MNSLLLAFHNAFNTSVCALIEQNGVFLKKKFGYQQNMSGSTFHIRIITC